MTAGTGVCSKALIRAADAMLRALGGDEISLLLPLASLGDDAASQLGLIDPGVEEARISPVIVRSLATANSGPRRRVEFLIPASGITQQLEGRDFVGADQLIDATLGIAYQGEVFHIEGFTTEYFAGAAYLYRIVAVE